MRRGGARSLNWFNDRAWPQMPPTPGHDGRAALLSDRAARLFFRQRLQLPELTAGALSLMARRFPRGKRRGRLPVE